MLFTRLERFMIIWSSLDPIQKSQHLTLALKEGNELNIFFLSSTVTSQMRQQELFNDLLFILQQIPGL